MTHYLQILKDNNLNNYLGIIFQESEVETFLTQLKEILGDNYEQFTDLQQERDGGKYHLTFLSVPEFNQKAKEMGFDSFTSYVDRITKVQISDLKLMGIGTAEKLDNRCYFVVCKSNTLDDARNMLGLPDKDLHITLGFKWKDVHGVPKNQILSPTTDFLKMLKNSYLNSGETFEFIKGFKNFDNDFFKLIEPIQINDTSAIFRCGDNDYIQISLVDNKITITGKWQDTNKLPILSTTLIEKKFKQIN